MVLLHQISNHVDVLETVGDTNVSVSGVQFDSRRVVSGDLFCCVPGESFDGHDYAESAIASGAVGLITQRRLDIAAPQLVVADVRAVLGVISAFVYGFPSADLTVVGVTGTNGKSSIVQLLADVWSAAGIKSEIIGTVKGARTTPEAPDLQRQFAEAKQRGVQAIALEVSSHALELGRVAGTAFDVAIFTNLTQDHLDFHPTMEAYFDAKAKLFTPAYAACGVTNRDDVYGKKLLSSLEKMVSYGLGDAKELTFEGAQSTFVWKGQPITLRLAGQYNVYNALAVASACETLGIEPKIIAEGLSQSAPVRGRFEIVSDNDAPFWVAVDYAHSPDALRAVLQAARDVTEGNIIVVFGCGGDRDKAKRPLMGQMAETFADLVIVTTDNPRSETAKSIAADILGGLENPDAIVQEPDRRKAIAHAVEQATDGDIVIIAGKGHENGQIVGDKVYPFDDIEVTREILGVVR